jgi:hypothetical protein
MRQVLLKNEMGVLPLKKAAKIAVIGLAGRLRRGHFVILPPLFSFVCRIPIVKRNVSDE